MAKISIRSEVFIDIYKEVRPKLEQIKDQRQGFRRAITQEMEPFFPGDVLEKLDVLHKIANRGISLAGTDASQIVLDDNETKMIEWSRLLAAQTHSN